MAQHAHSTARHEEQPQQRANGSAKPAAGAEQEQEQGHVTEDEKTDYSRWRLQDDHGKHTWHYLEEDAACEEWPQSVVDKHHLGMDTGLPSLPTPKTPMQSAENAVRFFSNLQMPSGHWASEYGGPLFLMPGLVITWYVTDTPIPRPYAIELKRYLFARQNPRDGGWGLHIEGESSVFGTAMNYTVLRLLGVDAEDARMVKARATLWKLGGAVRGPHWAKFWLAVLGVVDWDVVNPVPPELWLLPHWVPIHPWRWWVHMRQVFLPMSFLYSRRWSYPLDDLTRQLREELLTEPYHTIEFHRHRNDIAATDNYHPKTLFLRIVFWFLAAIWFPYLRSSSLVKKAEDHVWWLVEAEDENTDFSCLGPVNAPMNTLVAFLRLGPDSYPFRRHLETLEEFLWVRDEGMLVNGTNGVQVWDTAFAVQSFSAAGFCDDPRWRPMLTKALGFLEDQQILAEARDQHLCYRQQRLGAWGFSTKRQGYTVSDCTSEAVKAVLLLQSEHGFPHLIPDARIHRAVDVLLTMQNPSGGCASYEPTRGSHRLEHLNAAEVFGRIMVEYDYPECTTAVVTALHIFQRHYPSYRAAEISRFTARAVAYIRDAQRPDGSWYGSWGICFTYAGWFALESLACAGESHANSERVRRACGFFLARQMADGGWGETYRSCETGVWSQHARSQVVQTAWVVMGLLEAGFPEREPLRRAVRMMVGRQRADGGWGQEGIEGVFNKSCMISYPNYKFIFPIKALGMYAKRFGNDALL